MATEYSSGRGMPEQESASGLFSRLIGDVSALLRNEIALAKRELSEAATNAKLGAAALAVAVVVLLTGTLSLIAAVILGLAEVMPAWAAALCVGIVLALIGAVMLTTAKRRLSRATEPVPRTLDSLQEDAAVIARRT